MAPVALISDNTEVEVTRIQSILERARCNLNKSIAQKIVKAFEEDPAADFDKVIEEARQSYRIRYSKACETAKRRRTAALSDVSNALAPSLCPARALYGHQLPNTTVNVVSELAPTLKVVLSQFDVNLPFKDGPHLLKDRLIELIDKGTCLFSSQSRMVVLLSDAIVVKFGPAIALEELAMLHYIATSTSIPAPRPLGSIVIGETSYIFMTFIPGETLERRWPTLSQAQKTSVCSQLDGMFSEMRGIPHPPDNPLGTLSSPHVCKDLRMSMSISPPDLRTVSEFHDFLLSRPIHHVALSYRRWLRSQLRDDYRVMLTHGDFHPRNIMVRDEPDGGVTVSGIIDWEMGGWYPEYWEMYKALNTRGGNDESDWWESLPSSISGYDREVMERRVVELSTRS